MMNDPDADVLRNTLRVAVPVESAEKVHARRAALIEALERQIATAPESAKQARSRLRLRTFLWVGAAAAATLILTLGLGVRLLETYGPVSNAQEVSARSSAAGSRSRAAAAEAGHRSQAGKTFKTQGGEERSVAMSGGTLISLAGETRVTVTQDTLLEQGLRLTAGTVSVSVPPGRGQRSVSVMTPHATVRVKGTIFSVEMGRFNHLEQTPARTRVVVSRGEVLVEHATGAVALGPGESWISPIAQAADGERNPDGSAGLARARATDDTRGSVDVPSGQLLTQKKSSEERAGPGRMNEESSSEKQSLGSIEGSLAEQNTVLERALSAERGGDLVKARGLLEFFLSSYPSSPLRGSALAMKKRLDNR